MKKEYKRIAYYITLFVLGLFLTISNFAAILMLFDGRAGSGYLFNMAIRMNTFKIIISFAGQVIAFYSLIRLLHIFSSKDTKRRRPSVENTKIEKKDKKD